MQHNFGKYAVPPTLQKLVDLQKELVDPEQFYLGLNFFLTLSNLRYFNTPLDSVVFGTIGVDGIHYGFLTDYGSVTDLETAAVVCVSPMDDRPIRIVAKNIREFLSINFTDEALFYNFFENEASYLEVKRRWAKEAANSPYRSDEKIKKKEKLISVIMEKLKLPTIENPFVYVENIDLERQKIISIQTQDRLGVTTKLLDGEKHIPFPIQRFTAPDLHLLKDYLYSAPVASRLALFRDIQLNYILEDQLELRGIVIEAMNNIGLTDEARRLTQDREVNS